MKKKKGLRFTWISYLNTGRICSKRKGYIRLWRFVIQWGSYNCPDITKHKI